jgi:hypothetical protein
VLLNSRRYETPENEIKPKNSRGKTDIEIFVDCFGKSFRHGLFIFIKTFLPVVFLNPPYRETPKNVLKTKARKKSRLVGAWV